uniref:uncharacterized protein LOC113474429 n=1 Tax=Ciona intestinalis TaxID=7719 RepID=UPI000EF47D0A|nr:uncharacterized protein LOC113474429 [Ciona intestinalis]|eukprot:XP_026691263.1 uncharacterized protein LOC113474429 [Ciona intestinalis]
MKTLFFGVVFILLIVIGTCNAGSRKRKYIKRAKLDKITKRTLFKDFDCEVDKVGFKTGHTLKWDIVNLNCNNVNEGSRIMSVICPKRCGCPPNKKIWKTKMIYSQQRVTARDTGNETIIRIPTSCYC